MSEIARKIIEELIGAPTELIHLKGGTHVDCFHSPRPNGGLEKVELRLAKNPDGAYRWVGKCSCGKGYWRNPS